MGVMASLRIVQGCWVYDHRIFGRRRRITLGNSSKMTMDEALRALESHERVVTDSKIRQKAWTDAQMFSGKEIERDENGLRVSMRNIPRIAKNAKSRAKRNGLIFSLTENDLRALIQESLGRCCLSGISFSDAPTETRRRPFMPSIDRIDSKVGYTYDNCRIVCVLVNAAMNEWGMRALERVAMGMASHVPPFRVCR